MTTLTIQNVPDDVVQNLKIAAMQKGHSIEQEVREFLISRYKRNEQLIQRIRSRWNIQHAPSAEEIEKWIISGRERGLQNGH
jgi:hypothetical protein